MSSLLVDIIRDVERSHSVLIKGSEKKTQQKLNFYFIR